MNTQVEEVLGFLNEKEMRATYGAVAEYLGVQPSSVVQLLGEMSPRASWVVSTKEPYLQTDYPTDKMHPELERTTLKIATAAALERGLMMWRKA